MGLSNDITDCFFAGVQQFTDVSHSKKDIKSPKIKIKQIYITAYANRYEKREKGSEKKVLKTWWWRCEKQKFCHYIASNEQHANTTVTPGLISGQSNGDATRREILSRLYGSFCD